MLRHLRLFIILLLSFALPLTGMAGIEAPAEPCPMQDMGMDMGQMADMDHDGCQDMGRMTEHGKKDCKSGPECKTSSVLQVSVLKATFPTAAARQHSAHTSDLVLSQAPAELWRPPCA